MLFIRFILRMTNSNRMKSVTANASGWPCHSMEMNENRRDVLDTIQIKTFVSSDAIQICNLAWRMRRHVHVTQTPSRMSQNRRWWRKKWKKDWPYLYSRVDRRLRSASFLFNGHYEIHWRHPQSVWWDKRPGFLWFFYSKSPTTFGRTNKGMPPWNGRG